MGYIPPVGVGLPGIGTNMAAGLGGTAAAGGAAGAAGAGGLLAALGPMALPLLISFGPAILSKLFGGNPQQQLRDQIAKLQSPENLAQLANRYYQTSIASPAYSQALGTIAAGANQAAGNMAQSLGARGIGTSGTGAILSSLTPSIVGSQQANLRTEAYKGAQSQAMDEVKARIAALTGTQGPSQTQQYLGAGISSFSPYLQQFLKTQYPKTFGDMNTGGIQMGQEAVRR